MARKTGGEGSGSPNCSCQDRVVPVVVVFGARIMEREHQFTLKRRNRRSRGLRRRTLPWRQKGIFPFSAGSPEFSFLCASEEGEFVILLNLPNPVLEAMVEWD